MKLLIKENKILLAIIMVAVLISFITIGGRISVENQNKSYDIVLDYNEMEAMAQQSDHDVSWWLNEFKKMGITKVGLAEENMVSLIEYTELPIHASVMDVIMRDADWQSEYPDTFIQELNDAGYDKYDVLIEAASVEAFNFIADAVRERYHSDKYLITQTENGGYIVLNGTVKEALYTEKYKFLNSIKKGFVERDEIVSSKLMYINFGMLPSKIQTLKDAGMEIFPRTASYEDWNDTQYAKAVIKGYEKLDITPEYMIIGGESVIGYDDGIETAEK